MTGMLEPNDYPYFMESQSYSMTFWGVTLDGGKDIRE
jgi:hypothetical protein